MTMQGKQNITNYGPDLSEIEEDRQAAMLEPGESVENIPRDTYCSKIFCELRDFRQAN